ncbi:uncharacterized protein [Chelonus insularis]|uniref:uncharacterized protein n=1 Tax=Chelonus insularis TaxID=460826 RepID=UPI00158B17EC|nr:uncharacterized protein LOC118068990 [Chelonus insularis]XP_034942683.1 uncharacterized protein LOC118068990 [Chelonus insularis]
MKKYYQAALALTATLSIIALLFYRHEYNKLRFVLQFFNSFGSPPNNNNNNTCAIQFEDHLSSWQRVTHDLHIYSAYNHHDGEIISIALGRNTQTLSFACDILFSDEVEPIAGKFTYENININNDNLDTDYDRQFSGYLFKCKYDKNSTNKTVVGIQLSSLQKNNNELNNFPIIRVNTYSRNNYTKKTNVICVSPPMPRMMKYIDMVSFLAFHNKIGWNKFLVYDYGISPVFNDGIKKMELSNNWNFTYTLASWNFPYFKVSSQLMKNIIEIDCLHKNYNRANLAITLAWDEYINLKYHTSVENLIFDVGKVSGKSADKFQTTIEINCMNKNRSFSNIQIPMIYSETRVTSNINQNQPQYIYKLSNILNDYIIEQNVDDLLFIKKYQICNAVNNRKKMINGELRNSENLGNLKIFKYYLMGKLFSQ